MTGRTDVARRAFAVFTGAHTVRRLRWARNGALAALAVTAAACLLVSVEAHREITRAARHSAGAITEIDDARQALVKADDALVINFDKGDIALTGPGSTYADEITAANQNLVLAAGDNVAGAGGSASIQFSEGLLITYTSLVDQAVTDYSAGTDHTLGVVDLWYASDLLHSSALPELERLHHTEQNALAAQRRSPWLSPAGFWWPLLVPVLALLGIVVATSRLLWLGFRRLVSVRLALAVVLAAVAVATVGWATVRDERHLAAAVDGPLAHQSATTRQAIARTDASGAGKLRTLLLSACATCTGPADSLKNLIKDDDQNARDTSGTNAHVPAAAARHLKTTHHLEITDHAGGPMTLTIVFVLLGACVALAYSAYQPRLDEYRFVAS